MIHHPNLDQYLSSEIRNVKLKNKYLDAEKMGGVERKKGKINR